MTYQQNTDYVCSAYNNVFRVQCMFCDSNPTPPPPPSFTPAMTVYLHKLCSHSKWLLLSISLCLKFVIPASHLRVPAQGQQLTPLPNINHDAAFQTMLSHYFMHFHSSIHLKTIIYIQQNYDYPKPNQLDCQSSRLRNRASILNFVSVFQSEDDSTIRKQMKNEENGKAKAAIYQWFVHKRSSRQPISQSQFCV